MSHIVDAIGLGANSSNSFQSVNAMQFLENIPENLILNIVEI